MNRSFPGLACFAVLVALIPSAGAYIVGDGRGIFAVVIEVQEAGTGNFLDGVTVSVSDSGSEDLARDAEMKRFLPLFEPSRTNLAGVTIIYYYGGFSFETDKGKTQGVRGKLTLAKKGYEELKIDLREVLGASLKSEDKSLPRAQFTMNRKP